jgi:dTDP-4-amino-4,6-dideoxygalactose transaminase
MILMNDFKAEPQELRDDMLCAVSRVFESGWYVLGNEVEQFEKEWANTCNVKHAIGVGNGMDAIEIILRAIDVGPGDEVITTSMTAFATVLAILRSGATPVLADIHPDTGLLSMESVSRCISSRTRAVVLVHLYGQVRDINAWQSFCEDKKLHLVEDCAQAHLASSDGRVAGSFGVGGAYSFYPTKNLGTPGDGGALVTNCSELAFKAKRLRNYGQSERYHHPEVGMNSRLDEIHAAILRVRLNWLKEFTEKRREIAGMYMEGIKNSKISLMSKSQSKAAHVYHLFVIVTPKREGLMDYLRERGVSTLIHYPVPIHMQKPCISFKRDPKGLPHTEAHAHQCISLPCHPQMTDEQVQVVVESINKF